ncbi:DsrE family protein [Methanocrinis sp.]|uniref:DsrE family protein n=1 Tax=Methanocrinis sp. TaxID=3101522 RepID=UPI003D136A61
MKRYRAVFHLTEIERANLALNNVNNLLAELGEDQVDIELVTNSEGIKALLKAGPYRDKVGDLAAKGVRFVLCSKSLRALKMKEEEFITIAEVVPSGTGELVKRQTEGWAYVRP